ncbi:MAG: BMP family protein [Jannaschia sp.]
MKIAFVFVGALHDMGFNAAALDGADSLRDRHDVTIDVVSDIPFEIAAMKAALRKAAQGNDGVIFVGGQGNIVMSEVAANHPDKMFAVIQGDVIGRNLASYDVLQEQSAFLAGCLAARITRSGMVGHLSGHRVTPGLKGRAAFVAGAAHIDPNVTVLTGFCGTQDDSAVTRTWAGAQIAAGADILFTMLNAARQGAIDACRDMGARQIGNARDWCAVDPEVFIASAVARIDLGVDRAARDMLAGTTPASVQHLGLAEGNVVSLRLAPDVPTVVAQEMDDIAQRIRTGQIDVPTTYTGAEFMI